MHLRAGNKVNAAWFHSTSQSMFEKCSTYLISSESLKEVQPWGFSRVHMISLSFLKYKSRNILCCITAAVLYTTTEKKVMWCCLKQEYRERVLTRLSRQCIINLFIHQTMYSLLSWLKNDHPKASQTNINYIRINLFVLSHISLKIRILFTILRNLSLMVIGEPFISLYC